MRTLRRHVVVTLAVAAATLASATGVLADSPANHTGNYGVHFLQDSAEYPGAHCFYGNDQVISRVRVRFPIVYARDRTPARDSQTVAWRTILERSEDGSAPWIWYYQTPFQRATAFDNKPAPFTRIIQPIPDGTGPGEYRIIVRMRWYQPGSTEIPEGSVSHIVDWYAGGAFTPAGACPGTIF